MKKKETKSPKETAVVFDAIMKAMVKGNPAPKTYATGKQTPYEKYRASKFWKLVEKELKALEKNSDIKLKTDRDYIIGAIVKSLVENG